MSDECCAHEVPTTAEKIERLRREAEEARRQGHDGLAAVLDREADRLT